MKWVICECGASYAVYYDQDNQAHITDGENDIKNCPECHRSLSVDR